MTIGEALARKYINPHTADFVDKDLGKRLADDVDEALKVKQEQIDEYKFSFDLRWKADMRAIKRWRKAHPGNELRQPDHADLCVWLLEQLEN